MAHPLYEKAVAEYLETPGIQEHVAVGELQAAVLPPAPQSPEGVPSARLVW